MLPGEEQPAAAPSVTVAVAPYPLPLPAEAPAVQTPPPQPKVECNVDAEVLIFKGNFTPEGALPEVMENFVDYSFKTEKFVFCEIFQFCIIS